MQPAGAPIEREADFASSVVATMRQLGVVGLPRNYEIFYEALSGTNRDLSLEVVSLSNRPTQEELDRIGQKYLRQQSRPGHRRARKREQSPRNSGRSQASCAQERNHLEKYSQNSRSDGGGAEKPQRHQPGTSAEDRRGHVGRHRLHHRPRQAGRRLAWRQIRRTGKRQVEA